LAAVGPKVAVLARRVSNVMLPKTLLCGAVFACGLLALACRPASANDKKGDADKAALSGVWVQDGGEMKIEFADKGVMKLLPHGDSKVVVIQCQYTVEDKGLVKAKITELGGEARDKVEKVAPVGLEFSFKWTVKDGTGTIEEVKGEMVEAVKSHLEGKYSQKN
jgi:hypothetical protein